jgi:hypothetical protein
MAFAETVVAPPDGLKGWSNSMVRMDLSNTNLQREEQKYQEMTSEGREHQRPVTYRNRKNPRKAQP